MTMQTAFVTVDLEVQQNKGEADIMKIVILDAATIGNDIDLGIFNQFGEVVIFEQTTKAEVVERLKDAGVAILNKVKLDQSNLSGAKNLKLICLTATGFDNVDTNYARENGIAVCNVKGYSTDSVAQLTVSMVLSLCCHLSEYDRYCKSGDYTKSGIANCLTPYFYELAGKTWGLFGYGNIGKQVAKVAEAFGCKVIVTKNTPDESVECVELTELFERADIVSVHTPLNPGTYHAIGDEVLARAKKKMILVNVARGAVVDEEAVTKAVEEGRLGGFATDVYDGEPMSENSPFNRLLKFDNVIFTPHMAWGAYEARTRLMEEIAENIRAFLDGKERNRVEA